VVLLSPHVSFLLRALHHFTWSPVSHFARGLFPLASPVVMPQSFVISGCCDPTSMDESPSLSLPCSYALPFDLRFSYIRLTFFPLIEQVSALTCSDLSTSLPSRDRSAGVVCGHRPPDTSVFAPICFGELEQGQNLPFHFVPPALPCPRHISAPPP